ncbi:aminotransferase class V-fold PLP-dependent enzyme, partial [bacterium]|nr:aminotransferase class V-fold PLP-dependent enzyme [bacterium]
TGCGLLIGNSSLLKRLEPYHTGGDMVEEVTYETATWRDPPTKFEAGTPNIAGAVGLASALDYVSAIELKAIDLYERDLLAYATEQFERIEGLQIIGTAANKGSIISFIMEGVHPHDMGTIMDMEGVAVRTGHHCTQPVMDCFNIPATTRVSLSFYNTMAEIDGIVRAIQKVREFMGL